MMYGSYYCQCEEKSNPHRYVFTGNCCRCAKQVSVEVVEEELLSYEDGEYIQNALKNNTAGEREFLMSGLCEACFDEIFKE